MTCCLIVVASVVLFLCSSFDACCFLVTSLVLYLAENHFKEQYLCHASLKMDMKVDLNNKIAIILFYAYNMYFGSTTIKVSIEKKNKTNSKEQRHKNTTTFYDIINWIYIGLKHEKHYNLPSYYPTYTVLQYNNHMLILNDVITYSTWSVHNK